MKIKRAELIDLLVVIFIVIISVPIIIYFRVNFLTSTFLFFVVPSVYLFIRKPKSIKHIIAASLLFGLIFGFFLDFMAEFNNAWSWPPIGGLVFSYKILGVTPIDVMIWFFFWIFAIIVFYEHFLERDRSDKIRPKIKNALYPSLGVIAGMIIIFLIEPEFLRFDYAYLVLGLLTLPPFFYFIYKNPELLTKFLKISLYFAFLLLVFELTALKLDQWRFPGEYIASINVFGQILPFEEIFFWILISTSVVLSYY